MHSKTKSLVTNYTQLSFLSLNRFLSRIPAQAIFSTHVEIKGQLLVDATDWFFIAKFAQIALHGSGTIMTIFRRSRVIQMVAAGGTWRFGLQVVGLVWSCGLCVRFAGCCSNRTHNPQLHTRPTTCKPKRQVPQAATICITLDILMMGIMVPETC